MASLKHTQIKNPGSVTVIGGSGFVGRHVVGELAKRGYQVRVAVRRPNLAFHLQPLGDVGQIQLAQTNLRFAWSIEKAITNTDVVVNLVGILNPGGRQTFQGVHCRGATSVANICRENKVPLVHVSAIGAEINSASEYCSSKADGEAAVLEILNSAIILRPSIIFGNGDGFFNRFAAMAGSLPFLPLIGGGKTKFQPVYVGDVALAIVKAVEGQLAPGKIYELGGSEILSFRQCMELMLKVTGRNNGLIPIPWMIARLIAKLTGWIPGAPLRSDHIKILRNDNVVSDAANRQKRTLEGMGIKPRTLAAILPTFMVRYRPHGQYSKGSQSQNTA